MYAAPEVLTSTVATGYDAASSDMWSLGIILFSMLSGTLPFECAAASRCKRYAAVAQEGIQVKAAALTTTLRCACPFRCLATSCATRVLMRNFPCADYVP